MLGRKEELNDKFDAANAPTGDEGGALEAKLDERLKAESRLTEVRQLMGETENRLRETQHKVVSREQVVNAARVEVESMGLVVRETEVRAETVAEQLEKTGFEFEELKVGFPEGATIEGWEDSLEKIERRIHRLGAINLAAIGEYEEQSERKEYLDSQFKDLSDALETLGITDGELMPQRGDDLGARERAVFIDLFAAGFSKAVMIGSDLPNLPVSHLTRAVDLLESQTVVLGPARDGGYYLLGLTAPSHGEVPDLFDGIRWGTGSAFDDTVAAVGRAGLRVALVPFWYDVDDEAGLAMLRRDLAEPGRETAAPATAAVIGEIVEGEPGRISIE